MDAGVKLFLERGVEGVTIDEIVAEAGIAKGSFYRYFPDAAGLVRALFEPLMQKLEEIFLATGQRLREALSREELVGAYQRFARELGSALMEHPAVARLYLQECRCPPTESRLPIRTLAGWVGEGAVEMTGIAQRHGLLRDDIHPRLSALAVVGAVERLLFAALIEGAFEAPLEVPGQLISLILEGLLPNSSRS